MLITVTIRPGSACITATRSARNTASSMPCVTEKGRHAGFGRDPLQFDIHLPAQDLIQRAKGFVQKQHRRFADQGAGDGHTLPHATRKRGRKGIFAPLQSDQCDQVADAPQGGGDRAAQPPATARPGSARPCARAAGPNPETQRR